MFTFVNKERKLFKPRVSNSLALFSAGLLLVSAGLGAYSEPEVDNANQNGKLVPSLIRASDSNGIDENQDKVRSLSVSKLLFRHG